jgi:hypothetical protein
MEVAYAFLARGGEFAPDNTFSAFGGDITAIQAKSFPARVQQIVLIAKMLFTKEDRGHHHDITTELVGVDNANLVPGMKNEIDVPVPQDPESKVALNIAVQMNAIDFPHPGIYKVRLLLDGKEVISLKFELVELNIQG